MSKKLTVFLVVLLMITGCAVQPRLDVDNTAVDQVSKSDAPIVAINLVTNGTFEKYDEKTLVPTDWNFYNYHSYKSVPENLMPYQNRLLEIILKEESPCVFDQKIKFKFKTAVFNYSMLTKSDIDIKLKITLGTYTKTLNIQKGSTVTKLKFKSTVSEKTTLRIEWLYPVISPLKLSPLYIDDIELYDTSMPVISPL